MTLAMFALDW